MTAHDLKQPYMIYEGPRPVRPVAPEPPAVDAAQADGSRREAETGRGSASPLGLGLLVAGALAGGIAIGIWVAPSLRQPTDTLASLDTAAPLAFSLTHPTEEPTAVAVPLGGVDAVSEPALAGTAAPRRPATAHPARAAPLQRIKTASADKTQPIPRSTSGCQANGDRVQMTLCADPTIAAADRDMRTAFQRALSNGTSAAALQADQDDWLAFRDEAAQRSPGELAAAYEQRIAELNALVSEPPH